VRADARALVGQVLTRALHGLTLPLPAEANEVAEAAAQVYTIGAPAWGEGASEAAAHHAIRCAIVERLSPASSAARVRARQLRGLERQIFHAFTALDSVALPSEARRLNPCIAIGFELRPNTVHQHLSRARQKLFPDGSPQGALRFVVAPPHDVARAARDYLDVVEAAPGVAERWARAHGKHARRRQELKVESQAAARVWAAFLVSLDAAGLRPGDVRTYLHATSDEPGILDWIPVAMPDTPRPGKSWSHVLDGLPRPTGARLAGWERLLAAHPIAPTVAGRWADVARQSARAEQARLDLEAAWRAWLAASSEMPEAFREAKDVFRSRVEAW
jgi:hypothetical protein